MKRIIGIAILLFFIFMFCENYTKDENLQNLSNGIVTIVGLYQTFDIFFNKDKIDEVDKKLNRILNILENNREE